MLAIVWAIKHFKPYVYGQEFIVHSDHKPLVYLFNISEASDRLMRWRLLLEEYDFRVMYTPGKTNAVADALSRIELCNLDSADQITTQIKEEILLHKAKISKRLNVITRRQAKDLAKIDQSEDITNNSTKNRIAEDYYCYELLKDPHKNKEVTDKVDHNKNTLNVYIVPKEKTLKWNMNKYEIKSSKSPRVLESECPVQHMQDAFKCILWTRT